MLKNFKVFLIVTFILGAFNSFAQRGCAPAGSGLNVSSTAANNVPVGLCYINTVGERNFFGLLTSGLDHLRC